MLLVGKHGLCRQGTNANALKHVIVGLVARGVKIAERDSVTSPMVKYKQLVQVYRCFTRAVQTAM
jgi:hypothetical protein